MKKILIICLIVLCVLLQACKVNENKQPENQNSNDNIDLNETTNKINTDVTYGFGPVKNISHLEFTGEEIQFPIFMECVDNDIELGLYIFVNGIPQNYSIDDGDNDIFHNVKLTKGKRIESTINFKPSIGEKGDNLNMFMTTILNPSFKATKESKEKSFGHNHSVSSPMPIKINFKEDTQQSDYLIKKSDNMEFLDDETKKKYGFEQTETIYNRMTLTDTINNNTDFINLEENKKLQISALGDNPVEYRTTVFLNHKPVKVSNFDFFDIAIKNGYITNEEFNIKDYKVNDVIYTISVPINGDMTEPVIKTSSKVLI